MNKDEKIEKIKNGMITLGIEFGSTRIKSVLMDRDNITLGYGIYDWENEHINGIWTYSETAIWDGLRLCYMDLKSNILREFGVVITHLSAIGISGMMHGYFALNKDDDLLVPFRTWRNTMTKEASDKLTDLFQFPIPQRWSIAHLYQAILNKELHINTIATLTTLAGYVHYKLTNNRVLGIGEASGVFPIDTSSKNYNRDMIKQFNNILPDDVTLNLSDILPKVLVAGSQAGLLTKFGAQLLDSSGDLKPGAIFCPPEGDAGTGMIATNAIKKKTGNVSAGTSVFSMIVLEKPLSKPYNIIDIVTTPMGDDVAMVHVNNCTSDINAWVSFVNDVLVLFNCKVTSDVLYEKLFNSALNADPDTGNLLTYNYFSGEHITGLNEGRPLLIRNSDSIFSIANVMKANLFSAIAVLRIGMDVLLKEENVQLDSITGHGGLFRTPIIGQKMLASAINTAVTTMQTASEGGPFGMAVLANFMLKKELYNNLEQYLDKAVFTDTITHVEQPDLQIASDFNRYLKRYIQGLPVEIQAVKSVK